MTRILPFLFFCAVGGCFGYLLASDLPAMNDAITQNK